MPLVLSPATPSWNANWAWSHNRGGHGLTTRLFRRSFELDTVPDSLRVHVSADSRYRLWINGEAIGRGPIKGTLEHYFFETYDLGPHLRPGLNVLAAEVRWFGTNAPVSEVHSPVPGLLVQGPESHDLDTPGQWKVLVSEAVTPDTTSRIGNASTFLNHLERVDTAALRPGWTDRNYDDGNWQQAVFIDPVEGTPQCGVFPRRDLQPRDVPALIEEPCRFKRAIRDHTEIAHPFGSEPNGWRVEAGQAGEIVLDAGHLTTGYPELKIRGGVGRQVRITYTEATGHFDPANPHLALVKAVRDDLSGEILGYRDTLALDGLDLDYEPFHWRTFWFIRIEITAGPTPVDITDVTYRFTTFPQDFTATYASSDPDTERMWANSIRTLQLCAHETYEDCPYYEQLNYIADTRLQILASYHLANDTRLARRTIRLYRDSLRPDGLVGSRIPSHQSQILPYFALIWILTVEDYWQHVGQADRAFVRSCLYAVDGILWFFRERQGANGYIGPIPPWSMVDRADEWEGGMPPAIEAGESTYLACLYILALDAGVRLHTEAGEPLDALRWRDLPETLRRTVRSTAWSEEEGLYLEGPGRTDDRLSQHAQCLAILSDTATPDQTARILRRLISDESLIPMHLMQSYYLGQTLEKAGAYGGFHQHVLERWRAMLKNNLSTWQEYPDPTRSDCHAWSSWIAVDFITTVLGVRPGSPGWGRVRIQPAIDSLDHARGSTPTPAGTVTVSWRKEAGQLHLEAETPTGVPVDLMLPGAAEETITEGGLIRRKMGIA